MMNKKTENGQSPSGEKNIEIEDDSVWRVCVCVCVDGEMDASIKLD